MSANGARPRVTAVLGPTNTGKTHFAIERLVSHSDGVIGFPLRLLTRENYDRVVRLKGARQVALVTGEEKIVPPRARYFLCTAEAMPLDRRFAFVAVDEIQTCGDLERGHVFTRLLLEARGTRETLFLGSDTMRPLIRRLVPEAVFLARPRLSQLTHEGPRKLTRLPPRSAVIAFSAARVYEIAETLRRQRGGTAIVLGALSPRTRNAQAAMYQAGEVDHLVATDAIGMGLNMRLAHVAFFELDKFDGRERRRLVAAEIAQIAGRAGRYMTDGGFGTVAGAEPLPPETAAAVENHIFPPLAALRWRNAALDFASPARLLASLEARPPRPELVRVREADDQRALAALICSGAAGARAETGEGLRLLWEVCQIPDYRKTMDEAHTRLLAAVFGHLAGPGERLPTDWVAAQIAGFDRVDGDIDTLTTRIAHVRTWTFISHRPGWIENRGGWQARTRAIEDRLSDALHARLVQRFVDRRAALLLRRPEAAGRLAEIGREGEVLLAGKPAGRLDGLRYRPAATLDGRARRAAVAAAAREIEARARRLSEARDDAFALNDGAELTWDGAVVARLSAGAAALAPAIVVIDGAELGAARTRRVRDRLSDWLDRHLGAGLAPLRQLGAAVFAGAARGLAFQLVEALGSLPRGPIRALLADIGDEDRMRMRRLGVRFGREAVYLPALVKPRATRLRALLWSVHNRLPPRPPPPPGLCSVIVADRGEDAFYAACGYPVVGGRAIRIDVLDRLSRALSRASRDGAFVPTPVMTAPAGLPAAEIETVLGALGYRPDEDDGGTRYVRSRRTARRRRRRARPPASSPFAALAEMREPR